MPQNNQIEAPTFDQLITNELQKYDPIVPKVEELKKEFMPLTITNIEDKEGYDAVKSALKFIVGKRNEIEDKRKELKADSLKFGRAVDERAKEIQALIAPIEEHLKGQKEKIDQEILAIKQAAELAAKEKLRERQTQLIKVGFNILSDEYLWVSKVEPEKTHSLHTLNVEVWEDTQFNEWYQNFVNDIYNPELQAIAKNKEQEEAQRQQLAQQQQALKAEQEKLEQERQQIERERQEIKEGLQAMAQLKAQQEAQQQEQAAQIAEQERQANLTDKDKLQEFLNSISHGAIPELKGKKYKAVLDRVLYDIKLMKNTEI